jgi:hypothetical protein
MRLSSVRFPYCRRRGRDDTWKTVVRPWPWTQHDVVHLVVTTVGADGQRRRWYADLHTGPERGETIRLPAGTQIVRIERHRRVRVEVGKRRARHR